MIDEEGNSRLVNGCTGFEGIDVETQLKALAILYVTYLLQYIKRVCSKKIFVHREKPLENGGLGSCPQKNF